VTLAPLLALELFPSRPTRLGAFGTIQQEHLHSHIRLLARNDQRECSVARGMIRSLAEHMSLGCAHEGLPKPSHRSARGGGGKPSCRLVPSSSP
jgi:hypothetical protein